MNKEKVLEKMAVQVGACLMQELQEQLSEYFPAQKSSELSEDITSTLLDIVYERVNPYRCVAKTR